MRWGLVVAGDHASGEGREVVRALRDRGLRVRTVSAAGLRGATRPPDVQVERVDVVVVDATRSLEPAGASLRPALEAAAAEARLVLLCVRADQLAAGGAAALGLGPPDARADAGEGARAALVERVATIVEGREPPPPPPPIVARASEELRDAERARTLRVAAVVGAAWAAAWLLVAVDGGGPGRGWPLLLVAAAGVTPWLLLRLVRRLAAPPLVYELRGDELRARLESGAELCASRRTTTRLVEDARGLRFLEDLGGPGHHRAALTRVPRGVDGYERLREGLAAWRPIERHRFREPALEWALLPLVLVAGASRSVRVLSAGALLLLAVLHAVASIRNEAATPWRLWGRRAAAATLATVAVWAGILLFREERALQDVRQRAGPILLQLEPEPTLEELGRALAVVGARGIPVAEATGLQATPPRPARAWTLPERMALRVQVGSTRELRADGLSLVRVLGPARADGEVALVAFATSDPRDVVRALAVAPAGGRPRAEDLIAALEELAAASTFELVAVGPDGIGVMLTGAAPDRAAAARALARLAPGADARWVDEVARRLEPRSVFTYRW